MVGRLRAEDWASCWPQDCPWCVSRRDRRRGFSVAQCQTFYGSHTTGGQMVMILNEFNGHRDEDTHRYILKSLLQYCRSDGDLDSSSRPPRAFVSRFTFSGCFVVICITFSWIW